MDRKLKLPIGIDNFEKIRKENFYYVDKTKLIEQLLERWGEVNLFTRPRRFGKTLNMSMLKYFFEIGTDQTLFDGLYISDNPQLKEEYMGKFPVIFLSLKGVEGLTFENAKYRLMQLVGREANRFHFLSDSDRLTEDDKKIYHAMISLSDGMYSMNEEVLISSLKILSELLYKHYGKKTILLIDEYDVPLDKAFQNGYYKEMTTLIRGMFGEALKTNDSLQFAVLTGCLRVSKESIFIGLNNFKVLSIADTRFDEQFGFTDEEVQTLLESYGLLKHISETKEWYDGYLFGNTEIYNPWSVINYFNNNCKPKAFWSRTSGNEIIGELIRSSDKEVYESLSLLLQGKEVQSIINTDIIYPEVNADSDTIYSFLLVAGYLRATNVISEFNDNPICSLKLPNREIKSVFQKEILDNYNTLFNGSLLRDFELALRTGDTTLFTDTLQKYLLQSASTFDTTNENFYHGTVFGMLAILSDRYYISSNRESGEGRFDIQLEPKDKSQLGYIIEFKAGKNLSDTELADSASSAIQQIQSKKYSTDMEYHGIKKIGLFGIAFSGKRVAAKYEEIQLHS